MRKKVKNKCDQREEPLLSRRGGERGQKVDMTRMKEPSWAQVALGPTPTSLSGHVLFTGKTWAHRITHPCMQHIKHTYQLKPCLEPLVH